MPADHPADVMLPAAGLPVARSFYGGTLGLKVLLETGQFLTVSCGGDSRLAVTKSATGTTGQAAKACWRADDIATELAQLRARRLNRGCSRPEHRRRHRRHRIRARRLVHRPPPQHTQPPATQARAPRRMPRMSPADR
jgi:hypothetical protein